MNNKCLRQVRIRFTIVLDAEFDLVLNELLSDIYDSLTLIFQLRSSSNVEIISVAKGSIHLNGYFHMPDGQNDQNAFLENARGILAGQTKIANYPLVSSSFVLFE